ncbi:MAG: 5-formyltetrahydrofolate cyclo-ligase, partial [Caulobacteraceae bacterium]
RRAELIAARMAWPIEAHRAAGEAIEASLAERFPRLGEGLLGAYVPFRREFNCTPLLVRLTAGGGRVALPVVLGPGRPLEFRAWKPGDRMAMGVYDIPYPAEGEPVIPDTVISPLVGFDPAGYRLGYGAGYYDRTLASFPAKPLVIGVGFELSRMETIQPQPHDIPMDVIVTEAGVFGA